MDSAIEYLDKSINLARETMSPNNALIVVDYMRIGDHLGHKNLPNKAVDYYKNALLLINQIYCGYSTYQLTVYSAIALEYGRANDKQNAIDYCSKMDETLRKGCFNIAYYDWQTNFYKAEIYRNIGEHLKACEYASNCISISHLLKDGGQTQLTLSIFFLGGLYLFKKDYHTAIKYFLQAEVEGIAINNAKDQDKETLLGKIYQALGACNYLVGDFLSAINFLIKSEVKFKKQYGEMNIIVASINEDLGKIYDCICNFPWAIEYFERSLRIKTFFYGVNSIQTIRSCGCLANVYMSSGDYKKALDYYNKVERLLNINNAPGECYVDLYKDLFQMHRHNNDNKSAYECALKSIEITEKIKDQKPLLYIQALFLLLHFRVENRDIKSSFQLFEKLKKLMEENSKEPNDVFGLIYLDYGRTLMFANNIQAAIDSFLKALSIYKECFTDKSPYLVEPYHLLANAYEENKENQKAAKCYLKIISIYQRLGITTPNLGLACYCLGNIYASEGKDCLAIEYLSKAVNIVSNSNDPEYKDIVGNSYSQIARAYQNINKTEEALNYNNQALMFFQIKYGENHILVANCYCNIAYLYKFLKNNKFALNYFRKVEYVIDNIPNKDNTVAANLYLEVSDEFLHLKQYSQAIENSIKSLTIYKRLQIDDYSTLFGLFFTIISSYSKLGNKPKVLEWYQNAEPQLTKNPMKTI